MLLEESIKGLNLRADGIYLDGTLGRGGHSEKILSSGARLIAIDRDFTAIEETLRRLKIFGDRFIRYMAILGKLAKYWMN